MGTVMALGRRLPTVTLFPAGAENFASIGAARERETSTPGYRPGLRRRGGQPGGPLSPALPHHVSTLHHIHCTPFQHCTQTLSSHTVPPVQCKVPFPPCATATSCPSGQPPPVPGAAGLTAAVSIHATVLCSASQPGAGPFSVCAPAGPSWGCWSTRTRVHVHTASPWHVQVHPLPHQCKCCTIQLCSTAQLRLIKPKFSGQGITKS